MDKFPWTCTCSNLLLNDNYHLIVILPRPRSTRPHPRLLLRQCTEVHTIFGVDIGLRGVQAITVDWEICMVKTLRWLWQVWHAHCSMHCVRTLYKYTCMSYLQEYSCYLCMHKINTQKFSHQNLLIYLLHGIYRIYSNSRCTSNSSCPRIIAAPSAGANE